MNLYAQLAGDAAPRYAPPGQRVSHQPQADEQWKRLRQKINEFAAEDGEWAGAPLPLPSLPLIVEKRYPYQKLQGMTTDGPPKPPILEDPGVKVRNSWYCDEKHATVYVLEVDGKIKKMVWPEWGGRSLDYWIGTMGAAQAYTIEAELRALSKLKELIKPHLYEAYFLTGTFLETSRRTGITYVFRRLRPTVAIRGGQHRADRSPDGPIVYTDAMRILSILCLHPIGYYQGTWAGVMTPTDDVLAHLLLMRGDEALFWRKANHHQAWEQGAGL